MITPISVEDYLCVYDPRNPSYNKPDAVEDIVRPRENCACDNCFYGRDKLALEIIRLRDVADYGLAVLEEHREECVDLDGRWLRDKAKELGLLADVEVTEPCGDGCRCAEYDNFPQKCLRIREDIFLMLEERRTAPNE